MADSMSSNEITVEEGDDEEKMMVDSTLLQSKIPPDEASKLASEPDSEQDLSVRVKETSLRAFLVVAGVFGLNMLSSGTISSFGLVIDDFVCQFDTTVESVGFALGLFNGVAFTLTPLIAPLTKRVSWTMPMMLGGSFVIGLGLSLSSISPNVVWFSVAMVASGIGFAFVSTLSLIVFSEYFNKNFALPFGITDMGIAVGALFTLAAEKIVDQYGWRGTILIFGGLNFNAVVACALMPDPRARRVRQAKSDTSDESKGSGRDLSRATFEGVDATNGSLFGSDRNGDIDETLNLNVEYTVRVNQTPEGVGTLETGQGSNGVPCKKVINIIRRPFLWFWSMLDWSVCKDEPYLNFILLATLLFGVTVSGFYIFLIPHATAKGITVSEAVRLTIATGVGEAIGNLCQGPIVDRGWMTSTGLFMFLAGINGCLFLLDPLIEGVIGLTFCSFWYGICNGGQMTVSLVALKDATPPSRFATSYGLCSICFGLSTVIGGFFAGWMASTFGYEMMYVYFVGVSVSVVLVLVPAYFHYCRRKGDIIREELK